MPGNNVLPSTIPLAERTTLEGGAMFVTLPTLDELVRFWGEHRARFSHAAQGLQCGGRPLFLNAHEWVFGPTKASVVSTVCRWEQVGIRCQWYDWATDDPDFHAGWFTDRTQYRDSRIAMGQWSAQDEESYQLDIKVRTPETYRGWWELKNLPGGLSSSDWFGLGRTEVFDRELAVDSVTRLMQEGTYDDWKAAGADEVEFTNADGVDSIIAYWLNEQALGEDYYGKENEAESVR